MQTHFMLEEIYLILVKKFTGYKSNPIIKFDTHNSLVRGRAGKINSIYR